MCVTTLIATNQIVVLNFSLRSPSTHTMSSGVKHVSKVRLVVCVRARVCAYMCVRVRACVDSSHHSPPPLFITHDVDFPGHGSSVPGHGAPSGWQRHDDRGERGARTSAQLLRPHAESGGIRVEATSQWDDVRQAEGKTRSHTIHR